MPHLWARFADDADRGTVECVESSLGVDNWQAMYVTRKSPINIPIFTFPGVAWNSGLWNAFRVRPRQRR